MNKKELFKLIVTIVDKGSCQKVVKASKDAGAEGGTIIYGRGTGIHEQTKLFSLLIEPEKEVVLTLVQQDIADKVLANIVSEAQLDKPGFGIAFMVDVEDTAGINH
ncbi:MAG: P-II family nitrogen regulator [Balneolales bacterium]|nr:P-II family nitrogen regulator [Balneolales bacterium]